MATSWCHVKQVLLLLCFILVYGMCCSLVKKLIVGSGGASCRSGREGQVVLEMEQRGGVAASRHKWRDVAVVGQ